ncbi:MAG: 2-hydroxyacyl-CoA dehydratase [Candidatus Sericytochromatia bacterium]|nr:2-hydroxyacyl-CoA dehydratase [Candidatus Tanganyikabacteria bacterium]
MTLAAAEPLKASMTRYFRDLAESGAPVAWCTSVGPAELLLALGFRVYFPENHGAILGTSRMAGATMPLAHARGYSPDICSYLTSDIGAFLEGVTPLTRAYGLEKVPPPAVLVYNTNQCREVKAWFEWYGRELGVPVFGIHSPTELEALHPAVVGGVAAQLRQLAADLAPLAPRGLDLDELARRIALTREASLLWRECLRQAAARPTPWTFFDHVVHMGPIVVQRGTEDAVAYYRLLLAELTDLAQRRAGALPKERFRVYWEGMPIWGRLRALSDLFAGLGTALVVSTYCNSWILEFDTAVDPWEAMARTYLEIFICRSERFKEGYISRLCREFGADGVIFHDSRTCPHNTNTRFGLPRRLAEHQDLPALILEGDLNDLRCFSLEESRTRIEVFLEQLEDRVGANPGLDPGVTSLRN